MAAKKKTTPVQTTPDAGKKPQELGGMEVSTTFVYYCAMTTAIMALLASQTLDLSLFTPQPYRIGLVFGLVGGIVGAYFNHTASFSLDGAQAKLGEIETFLLELGYEPEANIDDSETTQDFVIYRRGAWSRFFSGPIILQQQRGKLTLISRASMIKRLRKHFQTEA